MQVSVVIPTKDSPTLLAAVRSVVASARRLPPGSVEVIVVDSSRYPSKIPEELGGSLDLSLLHIVRGMLAARIEGIAKARGEWVLNLDSDQVVHPDLLPSLMRASSPSVIIPEIPIKSDRWSRFVYGINSRLEAAFRSKPSLDIACIPRGYRRNALVKALEAIRRDLNGASFEQLPGRHEDTILFSYFLRSNQLSVAEAVSFTNVPIYHPVPPLEVVARKSLKYGRDLGSETREIRSGYRHINSQVWKGVYRVDMTRFNPTLFAALGWDLKGLVYDIFRGCFYLPGMLAGYLRPLTRIPQQKNQPTNTVFWKP